MTGDSVKKSKMKAAGLVVLTAACGILALRIHHRGGGSVKTQAGAPLSLLRAADGSDASLYVAEEGEPNAAGDDFAHRQAKEETNRPFLPRKYELEATSGSRVPMFGPRKFKHEESEVEDSSVKHSSRLGSSRASLFGRLGGRRNLEATETSLSFNLLGLSMMEGDYLKDQGKSGKSASSKPWGGGGDTKQDE